MSNRRLAALIATIATITALIVIGVPLATFALWTEHLGPCSSSQIRSAKSFAETLDNEVHSATLIRTEAEDCDFFEPPSVHFRFTDEEIFWSELTTALDCQNSVVPYGPSMKSMTCRHEGHDFNVYVSAEFGNSGGHAMRDWIV